MGSSNSKCSIVAQVKYPIYCVRMLGSRHVLVAGGGGASKTGIPNRIEVFLLELQDPEFDLPLRFMPNTGLETGDSVTSNLDIFPINEERGEYAVACGQDNLCRIFTTEFTVLRVVNGQIIPPHGAPGQNDVKPATQSNLKAQRKLAFEFQEERLIKTQFKGEDPYQKCVKFDPKDGRYVATGGTDGFLRLFSIESGEKLWEVEAHKPEVDALDVSRDGAYVITCGRDPISTLWNVETGSKVSDLVLPTDIPPKYKIRAVKFTGLGSKSQVFVTAVVPVQVSSKSTSYLALWVFNPKLQSLRPWIHKAVTTEAICNLALSQDDQLTAIATMQGSVMVFDTEELTLVRAFPQTHSNFVTGLEFMPLPYEGPSSISFGLHEDCRSSLCSVSPDGIQMHYIPWKEEASFTWFLIKVMFFLALLYMVLSGFGL